MTLSRRDFLRKTSIALAGGLIVGDAALEAFERLTHRKVWAGADFASKDQHGRTWHVVGINGSTLTLSDRPFPSRGLGGVVMSAGHGAFRVGDPIIIR